MHFVEDTKESTSINWKIGGLGEGFSGKVTSLADKLRKLCIGDLNLEDPVWIQEKCRFILVFTQQKGAFRNENQHSAVQRVDSGLDLIFSCGFWLWGRCCLSWRYRSTISERTDTTGDEAPTEKDVPDVVFLELSSQISLNCFMVPHQQY